MHSSTRLALLFLAAYVGTATGCAGWVEYVTAPDGGALHIEGLGERPAAIDSLLPFGTYATTESDQSMIVSDVPLEALLKGGVREGQFLHAQLLWEPKPGATPVDPSATNVTLRYVVVSNGKLGLYGGAGFAWPRGTPGEDPLTLVVQGSSLSLLASTEGFIDPLTPAQLTGTISTPPNEEETRRYRRGLSQLVTDAFGASRWVDRRNQDLSPDEVIALLFPSPFELDAEQFKSR
ncbi:MAG: hypothetical protein SGJ09_11370 [Phycisphaerae bacterium]|nr:hypothetical protein [Phycisphaerae bacterium]